jgi:hypothetical protein
MLMPDQKKYKLILSIVCFKYYVVLIIAIVITDLECLFHCDVPRSSCMM